MSSSQTPPDSGAGLLTADALLNTGLGALQILSAGIKNKTLVGGVEIAEEVVPLIEAAIENLLKVRGSPVTFGQLEGMRFTPQW